MNSAVWDDDDEDDPELQAAALRERYPSGGHGLPVTKEWIDSLYED